MAETQCSICKFPALVPQKDEFGKVHLEKIQCLGHTNILPYLWNFDEKYTLFENDRVQRRRKTHGE